MTTSTLDTVGTPAALPSPVTRVRLAMAARFSSYARERREVRAFRAQEKAFGGLCGAERADVLAASRR